SLINSISSNSIEQTRVEDADGNNSSNNSTTQREALDSNIQSDSFKEPRGNICSDKIDDESLCGKIVEINKPGRRLGDNNVPDSLRKIIGAESIESGRKAGLNLASHFGISPSSVSAYSHGSTGTTSYDKPNEGLLNHMNNARERIIKRARGKLLLS